MGRRIAYGLIVAGIAAPFGCVPSGPQALTGEAFMPKPSPMVAIAPPAQGSPGQALQGAAAPVDETSIDSPRKASVIPGPMPITPTGGVPLETPAGNPTTNPSDAAPASSVSSPTTQSQPDAKLQDGLYMTLGGVVADVNGAPIYANTLLALLDKQLSTKAHEMDPEAFRNYAFGLLQRQRDILISDEAELAAAQRLLNADDKKIIEQMAMPQYRQQLITEAGGSVELAKHRAKADGQDFDELMRQHYRQLMQQMFYQRRIWPRVQVSAADMRDFYRANLSRLYTENDQAKFRVIKIDPARIGGPNADAAALDRARLIREKAVRGDDFTALASSENQDDYLKARGGDPGGWMQRGSYRIDEVDKAVWKLSPGQVSEIISADGAYYIAMLEDRKMGHVRSFEDQSVQDEIRDRLRQAQFASYRDGFRKELNQEAVIRADDSALASAVDMAMQKYAQWVRR